MHIDADRERPRAKPDTYKSKPHSFDGETRRYRPPGEKAMGRAIAATVVFVAHAMGRMFLKQVREA